MGKKSEVPKDAIGNIGHSDKRFLYTLSSVHFRPRDSYIEKMIFFPKRKLKCYFLEYIENFLFSNVLGNMSHHPKAEFFF